MKKLFIISGVMLALLAVENVKAQEVNAQSEVSQPIYQETATETETSARSEKSEKMKAEKPKFKHYLKEYGNEADMRNASEKRDRVVVEIFDRDGSVSERYAAQVRNYLISAIEDRGRLDVVNPLAVGRNEKKREKTEYFGDGKFKNNDRFDSISNAGIRFVVSGEVLDYDTNEYHNSKGKVFHESTLTVRFTAYDLKEKEVLMTYNEKAAEHGYTSRSKADDKLIEGFNKDYENFIEKSFKLCVSIKEVSQTTKKGVIRSCLINAGKEKGIAVNDIFDVYIRSGKSGGDWKKIGKMKATKNIYSEFSECNVVSGAKQIAGVLATGNELILLSDGNSSIF